MTDNEIKRALGCCMHSKWSDKCSECFYAECDSEKGCVKELLEDALDLINRQQAKIEELTGNLKFVRGTVERQKAEIERLQNECFCIANEREAIKDCINTAVEEAKAEAIKEFAERLKEEAVTKCDWDNCVDVEDIDNLVKEMVGE